MVKRFIQINQSYPYLSQGLNVQFPDDDDTAAMESQEKVSLITLFQFS
jgi:hypothetical protein